MITIPILVDVEETEINFLFIDDKGERDNITPGEIKVLLKEVGLDDNI